jgi:predicted transcriptional regulator
MKCKIENCGFESADLSRHVLTKHNMSGDDYKILHGAIVDDSLKLQRAESRRSKYTICCHVCLEKFSSQNALIFHLEKSEDIEHNHSLYNESNADEWVECKVCRKREPTIIRHITKHGLNIQTYSGEVHSKEYKKRLEKSQIEKRNLFEFKCRISNCQEKFSTEKALNRHIETSKDIEHNHFLYNDINYNDWIECKICGYRKMIITDHLRLAHSLGSEEYKQKYNAEIFTKNYYENQLKAFSIAGTEAPRKEKEKTFECPVSICKQKFSTEYGLEHHIENTHDKGHSQIFFNETNQNEWVECKVEGCGYRSKRIDFHVKDKHKLTLNQYEEQYCSKYLSKSFLEKARAGGKVGHEPEKWQGEKNPFYGKNHTEASKKQISLTLLNRKDSKQAAKIMLQQTEKLNNQDEKINEILGRYKK